MSEAQHVRKVSSEAVRTPVVGSSRPCRGCGINLGPDRKGVYCSARCRARDHRRRREVTLRTRDQEIRTLLEAALRKLGGLP